MTPVLDRNVKTNGTKRARLLRWEWRDAVQSSRNTWGEASFWETYKRLRSEQFDLGVSEVVRECGFAIFNKIGLQNYVSVLATNLLEYYTDPFGVSSNPSHVPYTMSYKERAENLLDYLVMYVIGRFVIAPLNGIYEKCVGNRFNTLASSFALYSNFSF
ncbi:unnamed protein product [Gongylonema pulchrum]|uniref:Uncharacterized protein n=1 Tax=Gongylonema pulchrum TaxID=637853 RepID=A0A3P7RGR8_9BILA|nr:unnamed protein product [Gongylonema pulchrum]